MVDKQIQGTFMGIFELGYFRECTLLVIAAKRGACSAIIEMLYTLSK